jgi:hypothetical protein
MISLHPRGCRAGGRIGAARRLRAIALSIGLIALVFALAPEVARACACGCGVFDVGTANMLPHEPGGIGFIEYDYQDQTRNWSGASPAPTKDNGDLDIRTHFVKLGLQYMLSDAWGFEAELPYAIRRFRSVSGDTGEPATTSYSEIGDVRIRAIYAGFLEDMSLGVTAGLKLPTGEYTASSSDVEIDRDTQIGSGSTDLLLGAFDRGGLGRGDLGWFAQALLDLPFVTRDLYHPGLEVDGAVGVDWLGAKIGEVHVTPIAQLLASVRTRDTGPAAANPVASGYERVLVSPGIEVDAHPIMLYADVEFPIYQRVNGDQLVAPVLVKVMLGVSF